MKINLRIVLVFGLAPVTVVEEEALLVDQNDLAAVTVADGIEPDAVHCVNLLSHKLGAGRAKCATVAAPLVGQQCRSFRSRVDGEVAGEKPVPATRAHRGRLVGKDTHVLRVLRRLVAVY